MQAKAPDAERIMDMLDEYGSIAGLLKHQLPKLKTLVIDHARIQTLQQLNTFTLDQINHVVRKELNQSTSRLRMQGFINYAKKKISSECASLPVGQVCNSESKFIIASMTSKSAQIAPQLKRHNCSMGSAQLPQSSIIAQTGGEREYPKPIFSYSCLVALSLKNSRTGRLQVSEIYNFMCENFPHFRTAPPGWKNSVRHNLSVNKWFVKVEIDSPAGQGRKACLWMLNPAKVVKVDQKIIKWRTRDPQGVTESLLNPEDLEAIEKGLKGMPTDSAVMCPLVIPPTTLPDIIQHTQQMPAVYDANAARLRGNVLHYNHNLTQQHQRRTQRQIIHDAINGLGTKPKRIKFGQDCFSDESTQPECSISAVSEVIEHQVESKQSDPRAAATPVVSPVVVPPDGQYVICYSNLSHEQKERVATFMDTFKIKLIRTMHPVVTHLIIGAQKVPGHGIVGSRTLKFVQATVGKKWIVNQDWVDACIEKGKIVDQEPFEVNGDVAFDQPHYGPRKSRTDPGGIFDCVNFWILPPFAADVQTEIGIDDFKELLQTAGGNVVEHIKDLLDFNRNLTKCFIIHLPSNSNRRREFESLAKKYGIPTVNREWTLDCILSHSQLPFWSELYGPSETLMKLILAKQRTDYSPFDANVSASSQN